MKPLAVDAPDYARPAERAKPATYVIRQLAITGKYVTDGGEHVEYPSAAEAEHIARQRTAKDGAHRRVERFRDDRVVVEVAP